MSNTSFKVNPVYFTEEITNSFVNDLETACQTMDAEVFDFLFIKYNLLIYEEYEEVYNLIKLIMTSWNKPAEGSVVLEVTPFDSKCIYCVIGKSVKGYEWSYQNKMAVTPLNRVVYKNKIAFFLDFKNNRLIEFGVCNAFLSQKEMIEIK